MYNVVVYDRRCCSNYNTASLIMEKNYVTLSYGEQAWKNIYYLALGIKPDCLEKRLHSSEWD